MFIYLTSALSQKGKKDKLIKQAILIEDNASYDTNQKKNELKMIKDLFMTEFS